jgi:hypothetical protein
MPILNKNKKESELFKLKHINLNILLPLVSTDATDEHIEVIFLLLLF